MCLLMFTNGFSLGTAVEHDSKGADGYGVLTNVIRGGCKAVIWLSAWI